MSDKAWKAFERRVADFFNGQRNPLSGSNSRITAGDVIHERLFIECKQRQRIAIVRLWDGVKRLAVKENKTPVVCLAEKNRPGFWILVHSEDLLKL